MLQCSYHIITNSICFRCNTPGGDCHGHGVVVIPGGLGGVYRWDGPSNGPQLDCLDGHSSRLVLVLVVILVMHVEKIVVYFLVP